MNRERKIQVAVSIVVLAAVMRLLPHIPNFTPVAAMAVFAGAVLPSIGLGMALVLAVMVLSDLAIGFDVVSPVVYFALVLSVFIGRAGSKKPSASALALVCSSVSFFVLTNFAVWALQGMYPHSAAGLATCFTMAIPFFHYTLLGDLFYGALFFGTYALFTSRVLLPARS